MISHDYIQMKIEEGPVQTPSWQSVSSYTTICLVPEGCTVENFEDIWTDIYYRDRRRGEKTCLAIEISEETRWEKLFEKVFEVEPSVVEKIDYVDFRGSVSFENLVGLYKQYRNFLHKEKWPTFYISLVLKPKEHSQDLKKKLQEMVMEDASWNKVEKFSEDDWVQARKESEDLWAVDDTWKPENGTWNDNQGKSNIGIWQDDDNGWNWDSCGPSECVGEKKDVILEGFLERLCSKDM